MASNEVTITYNIGKDVEIEFSGVFTPYWPGVRYYRDGSGDPPTPEEYDINSSKLISGDPVNIIIEVDNYYDTKIKDIRDEVKKEIEKMFARYNIEVKLEDNEWYWILGKITFDSFLDDISIKIAEQIQEDYDTNTSGDY